MHVTVCFFGEKLAACVTHIKALGADWDMHKCDVYFENNNSEQREIWNKMAVGSILRYYSLTGLRYLTKTL